MGNHNAYTPRPDPIPSPWRILGRLIGWGLVFMVGLFLFLFVITAAASVF
ncbi:membrane protein [Rhodococcus phage Jflix2]|nr:membrane protein [Rhodococcus phage Jflix2]